MSKISVSAPLVSATKWQESRPEHTRLTTIIFKLRMMDGSPNEGSSVSSILSL